VDAQFYWWRKPEYPVFEIRLEFTGQKTSKLEYLYRFY
jgi:hypothetical protein